MQWFAQVSGQVYGPFSDAQMQGFVSEGRVNGQSLVSNSPHDGFFPAIGYDIYSFWIGSEQIVEKQAVSGQAVSAHPVTPQASPRAAQVYNGLNSTAQSEPTPYPADPQAHTQLRGQTRAESQVHIQPHDDSHVLRQFTIMAEVKSESLMVFLEKLQTFGTAERIGDTVWILKSSQTADSLRNALSQTLTRKDRLFIIDSKNNKTAWFNIGADLDGRIRRLWEDEA